MQSSRKINVGLLQSWLREWRALASAEVPTSTLPVDAHV